MLTKEQKELVENNHNLIYHCMKKFGVYKSSTEFDDYYEECAYRLCKAAETYNPERGANFATYACICIQTGILLLLRDKRKSMKYISFEKSINEPISIDLDGNSVTIEDTLTTGLTCYDEILTYELQSILTDIEYTLVILRIQGYTQTEIGKILNYSQGQISKLMKSIRCKIERG